MEDCIFLLADGQMEQVFKAVLESQNMPQKLNVRPFSFNIIVDTKYNDSGVYTRAHNLLFSYRRTHAHALVVLDHRREGAPPVEHIRDKIIDNLRRTGWQEDQMEVIIINPELEIWLWQDSPHMFTVLNNLNPNFNCTPYPSLRKLLEYEGRWKVTDVKPILPKDTFRNILRRARVPDSGAVRANIAKGLSIQRCTDPAFCQLRDTLRRWFPPANPNGDYS